MNDTKQHSSADFSGRFVLRIDPGLHGALRAAAEEAGLSLNEYCARKLALPAGRPDDFGSEVVSRAAALFGDALIGVVLFGSFARGMERTNSDVDIMIILESSIRIERSLYQQWDEEPLTWKGHPVEPHFVHLPEPGERVSALWAELSVDGVILFERGFAISRYLVHVRSEIADGRLTRRTVHAQHYWVETETENRYVAT